MPQRTCGISARGPNDPWSYDLLTRRPFKVAAVALPQSTKSCRSVKNLSAQVSISEIGTDRKGRRRERRGPLISLNQLCHRNCCGLRAEPCEMMTLTRAGPWKFIAASRAPRKSFGSSTKKPLPPKASITLS
jgi:hypothetical protein